MAPRAKKAEPMMVSELREAIRASGRTLTSIAKDAGLDSGRISRFMSGKRDLTFSAVCRICEAIGGRLSFAPSKPAAKAKKRKK
jgi:DNA-binding phage protein